MTKKILSLLMAALFFAGCNEDDNLPKENNERGIIFLTAEENRMARNSNVFAFKLLDAVNNGAEDNSQFAISPLSASMALSMALNGATGETLDEIEAALGFSGSTLDIINTFNNRLLTNFPKLDKTAKVNLANSLWLNGVTPLEQYKSTVAGNYKADIFTRDFSAASTLGDINSWCSGKTSGKIKEMFQELDPAQELILINAIYFKALWATPFTTVTPGTFTTQDGEEQTVDFMNGEQIGLYYVCDKFKAYGLYYGNRAFIYNVVVPEEGVTIDECIADISSGSWEHIGNDRGFFAELNITMPKFETSLKADITQALSATGIKKAFTPQAEFMNIIENDNVHINRVLQATTFKVDELGAEASSVTTIDGVTSALPMEKIDVVVDRPFLFFVRECSTGVILFAGKIGRI